MNPSLRQEFPAEGRDRAHLLALVDPLTDSGLDGFMEQAPRPTVVDDEGSPTRAAFGFSMYQLALVAPDGQIVSVEGTWYLPRDSAALETLIRDLLADGGTTPPPADVVTPGEDIVAPPDTVAPLDVVRPQPDIVPIADVPAEGDSDEPVDVQMDTAVIPDVPAEPDGAPLPDTDSRPDVADVTAAPDIPADVTGEALEAFALTDLNPVSPWYDTLLRSSELLGSVYFLYFASAG